MATTTPVTAQRGTSYRVTFAADRYEPTRTYGSADAELLSQPPPESRGRRAD